MEHKFIPMKELLPLLQLQMDHGEKAVLVVTGVSMLPLLVPYRDKVFLEKVRQPLRSGDLILYRREDGSFILHRIIRVGQPMICCGDNQWQSEWVYSEQVIARVAAFQRNGKDGKPSDALYRIYTFLWVRLYCLRRPYIWLRRRMGKFCKRKKQNK